MLLEAMVYIRKDSNTLLQLPSAFLTVMIIFNCSNGVKYRQGIEKKTIWLQEKIQSPCQRDS